MEATIKVKVLQDGRKAITFARLTSLATAHDANGSSVTVELDAAEVEKLVAVLANL